MATAIIQARISSSRLPGKVLLEIDGTPILSKMIDRVKKAKYVEEIVIATSTDPSDDPIEAYAKANNIPLERGSLNDVLDRYYQAAKRRKAKTIIRLTGDCPLIDPEVIDLMVLSFRQNQCDYISNTAPSESSTYPDGMDVEIFSMNALERSWKEAKKPSEREHVTFYFWKNPHLFKTHQVILNRNLSNYRVTVDYQEDC